eukprot:Nk52_evm20s243 gene=Nk52_evmTU20s243
MDLESIKAAVLNVEQWDYRIVGTSVAAAVLIAILVKYSMGQSGAKKTEKRAHFEDATAQPFRSPATARLVMYFSDQNDKRCVEIKGRRFSVSAESLNPNQMGDYEKVVIPKSNEAKMRIASACANNLLFRNLDQEQKKEIVDAMFEKKVAKGESIIKQGDEGDNFYVVDQGSFDVFVSKHGGPSEKVVEVKVGGSFGELALMYNTPRAATVTASEDSVLWAVDRVTFRKILMETTFRKRKVYEGFVSCVPILQNLTAAERSKIVDALEPITFEDEDAIISQGDMADGFYIVEEGEAVVVIDEDGEEKELNRLKRGDYFGEIALINEAPRSATVKAVGDCKCAVLDKQAFIRLLGPCIDILKRNFEKYKNK